jgi:carboxymethylenebutenolidase
MGCAPATPDSRSSNGDASVAAREERKEARMTQARPDGFLVVPRSGRGPGVLVLHPWWGLNDTMKDLCTRLAAEGFVAFAPDLYHGKVAITIAGAESLSNALSGKAGKADVARAVEHLAEKASGPDLAVIGFSMGAYFAIDLAAADPARIAKVVVFYGTGPADHARSKAEYLGHFAKDDPYEPDAGVGEVEEALRKAGRPVTFHRYDAGHWFFEPDRTDAYDPAAAKLAWDRTLAFLKR